MNSLFLMESCRTDLQNAGFYLETLLLMECCRTTKCMFLSVDPRLTKQGFLAFFSSTPTYFHSQKISLGMFQKVVTELCQ